MIRHIFISFLHLGSLGLLLLGVLDSSFFFLPFGNDLLLIGLTARNREHLPLYVLAAACGSGLGVLLLDVVARKGGEAGLKKMMKQSRIDYFKKKMEHNAASAIILACLAPPPFPFTAVIAASSAFAYPRIKLLGAVLLARVLRFTVVGILALMFGRQVMRIAQSPVFVWAMVGFIALCAVVSAISVAGWIRRSRSAS